MGVSLFENTWADRTLKWAVVAAVTALAVITVLYTKPVFDAVGWRAVAWVYNAATVFFALAGAGLAFLLWRASDPGEALKRVWGVLGLGMLLWSVGETIWAYYQLALKEGPTVSVADMLWAVAYLPLFLSLLWRFRALQTVPNRKQLQVAVGFWAVLLLVVIVLVIGPMAVSDDFESRLEKIILIFYPVGDLVIAFVALLSVLVLIGGTLSRPVVVIMGGFLALSLSDLLYSYANWQGSYLSGGLNTLTAVTDISYVASYMIIAFGLLMQARLQRAI